MHATDASAATALKERLSAGLDQAEHDIATSQGNPKLRERLERVLQNTTIQTDGDRVVANDSDGGTVVVVALAAIVASFVLGLGSNPSPQPTTAFAFDYEADNGRLTITHDAGDAIPARELYVLGEGIDPVGAWRELDGDTSATIDGQPAVVAGDSVTVSAASDYDVDVVWRQADGSQSATLSSDYGPDA